MSDKVYELIDEVEIYEGDSEWTLRLQQIRNIEEEDEGYRFVWVHRGIVNAKMNAFLTKNEIFELLFKAVEQGMI